MRELVVQAANDTNTYEGGNGDRATIQLEIEQLSRELVDLTTMTEFNGIPLLCGRHSQLTTGDGLSIPPPGEYISFPQGIFSAINLLTFSEPLLHQENLHNWGDGYVDMRLQATVTVPPSSRAAVAQVAVSQGDKLTFHFLRLAAAAGSRLIVAAPDGTVFDMDDFPDFALINQHVIDSHVAAQTSLGGNTAVLAFTFNNVSVSGIWTLEVYNSSPIFDSQVISITKTYSSTFAHVGPLIIQSGAQSQQPVGECTSRRKPHPRC